MTEFAPMDLACECGAKGRLEIKFVGSSRTYYVTGFEGIEYTRAKKESSDFHSVISAICPKCPDCNETGRVGADA